MPILYLLFRNREELSLWGGQLRPVDAWLYELRSRVDEQPHSLEQARDFRIVSMQEDAFHNYFSAIEYPHLVMIGCNAAWLSLLESDRIGLVPFSLSGTEALLRRHEAASDRLEPLILLDALSYPLYLVMNVDSDSKLVEETIQAHNHVDQNCDVVCIAG